MTVPDSLFLDAIRDIPLVALPDRESSVFVADEQQLYDRMTDAIRAAIGVGRRRALEAAYSARN